MRHQFPESDIVCKYNKGWGFDRAFKDGSEVRLSILGFFYSPAIGGRGVQ